MLKKDRQAYKSIIFIALFREVIIYGYCSSALCVVFGANENFEPYSGNSIEKLISHSPPTTML